MSENYTSTQCFPSGRMIRHAGSYPHFTDESGNEFDRDTQDIIQANLLAENYVRNEVLCCDSALVGQLIANNFDGFSTEESEIENLYPDPSSWTVEECREYIEDHGGKLHDFDPWKMRRDELIESLHNYEISFDNAACDDELMCLLVNEIDDQELAPLDEWRQAVSDCAEPAEVYEWWRVSDWLCRQLRDIGEVVIDNDYGCWWGRTCTGQSMIMDGTLQAVAMQSLARTNELIGR